MREDRKRRHAETPEEVEAFLERLRAEVVSAPAPPPESDDDPADDSDKGENADAGEFEESAAAAAPLDPVAAPLDPAAFDHPEGFRCGFVAILGKPNAGKSTLLNRLVGEKVAIVSPRPQTTRDRIHGILTEETSQIVFVDMPGLVNPRDLLNQALVESIRQALDGIDAVVHLIDVTDLEPLAPPMPEILAALRVPVLCVLNKIDVMISGRFDLERRLRERPGWIDPARYEAVLPVSATTGEGLPRLLEAARGHLPEGPPLYDPDIPTDRDMRWLVAETVREKVFLTLGEEVPYAIACETDEFQEREDGKWLIRIVIHVERESQKGIVIGAGGQTLKKIGRLARAEIETLVDHPVYLELWVKVRKNWRKKENELRRFGYIVQGKKKKKTRP